MPQGSKTKEWLIAGSFSCRFVSLNKIRNSAQFLNRGTPTELPSQTMRTPPGSKPNNETPQHQPKNFAVSQLQSWHKLRVRESMLKNCRHRQQFWISVSPAV